MSTPRYKKTVRERDIVCQGCGTVGTKNNQLTVHHIKPKCRYPELEKDPDNCTLLCQRCHTALHKKQGYPTPIHKPYERLDRYGRRKEKPKDRKRRLRREAKNRKKKRR